MLADRRIGFVGAGAMAEALAGGLVASGVGRERLLASDIDATRRQGFEERTTPAWPAAATSWSSP